MPANLPPDARKKWAEVETTRNPRERLQRMEEFMSVVPKHKGTLKLRGYVKKQMASIRKELDEKRRKRIGKTGPKFFLEKEGAAQIAVIGTTNVGKSSLLTAVTNAKVEISPDPYTTRQPVPGIMNYEDIQFQLIEAPALMEGSADGRAWGLQTLAIARNADALIIMIDLSQDPVGQTKLVLREIEKTRILITKPKGRIEIERKHAGVGMRVILIGKLAACTTQDIEELLKSYRITDAVVKVFGEATLDDVEDSIFENTTYKPTVVLANKTDRPDSQEDLTQLRTCVGGNVPIIAVSCETKQGLEKLGEILFGALGVFRVYTKEPNQRDHSKKPVVMRRGATVFDLAKDIHSDFKTRFSFAKVWAKRLVFSPQKVGIAFGLDDGDIVEIHVK